MYWCNIPSLVDESPATAGSLPGLTPTALLATSDRIGSDQGIAQERNDVETESESGVGMVAN
jgi:hypothetical protein